jgi:hypothetical protein
MLTEQNKKTDLFLEIESPPAEFEAFASQADQVLQTLKLWR